MLKLGDNIEITGFKELERDQLVIVKKIVGNHVKKISDQNENFKTLKLTLKPIHKTKKSQKYEIKGNLDMGGKIKTAEITDYNLFFAISQILNKLEGSVKK